MMSFIGKFRKHDIAAVIGITGKTLVKYYRKGLDLAFAKTGVQLVDVALRKAIGAIGKSAKPDPKAADDKMLRFFLERKRDDPERAAVCTAIST
jgi:hypothetical protein